MLTEMNPKPKAANAINYPANEDEMHRKNELSPSTSMSFQILGLRGREAASSGLWLCALIPLACFPGFYTIHSHCKPTPLILSTYAVQVGFSSMYILLGYYKHRGHTEKKTFQKWPLWVLTHKFVPLFLSTAIFLLNHISNPIIYACALLCCSVQHKLTVWILEELHDSFSIGESLLVGQAASLTLSLSVKGILVPVHTESDNKQLFLFSRVAVLTASLMGFIIWKQRRKMDLLRVFILTGAMGILGIGASSWLLREWSPQWLFQAILSPTRMALMGWWINISVLILLTACFAQRYPQVPSTVLRKVFHLLMILIMLPGIILDPSLTYLVSTGALILFLLLEVIRVAGIEPLSGLLNSTFWLFLDEKDCGSLILSHIYLVVGLSLPLWLYPCDFLHTGSSVSAPEEGSKFYFSVVPLLAGVLSVGIGDSAASVGGTYFGRHRFPGTKKTVEGCLCSVLSQVIFVFVTSHSGLIKLMWNSWPKLILAIVISSIVEGFTNQVDNLVLPLLLYTPLMDP